MDQLCQEFESMMLNEEDESELAHLSARLVAQFPGCTNLEEFRLEISVNFYKEYYAIIYAEACEASKEAADQLRRCFEQMLVKFQQEHDSPNQHANYDHQTVTRRGAYPLEPCSGPDDPRSFEAFRAELRLYLANQGGTRTQAVHKIGRKLRGDAFLAFSELPEHLLSGSDPNALIDALEQALPDVGKEGWA
uniref:RIIa domain-containing protein n=2 Tax=Bursaphelenchus xylophilus TaxID=6326 RepID=A0A1I7S0C1_BURXY